MNGSWARNGLVAFVIGTRPRPGHGTRCGLGYRRWLPPPLRYQRVLIYIIVREAERCRLFHTLGEASCVNHEDIELFGDVPKRHI